MTINVSAEIVRDRIAKHIINNQTGLLEKTTYYILDASGKQLSVYEHEVDAQDVTYILAERQTYGSSHLGTLKSTVDMYNASQSNLVSITLGEKRYSMSDHRGNVNTVISDIKIPISTGTTVDYFDVAIMNIADFSPFNVELDGRTMKNDFYRYSVQGQEGHDEIHGEGNYINYKYRGYDPRVGRLDWSLDPLAPEYPHNSPYAFSENRVIDGIELEGLEFLNANEALIQMSGGRMYLQVENFGYFAKKNIKSSPAGDKNQLGMYPVGSGKISINKDSQSNLAGPSGMQSSERTTSQKLNDRIPRTKSSNFKELDQRFHNYKEPSSVVVGSRAIGALNVVVQGLQLYQTYNLAFDIWKFNSQKKLIKPAMNMLNNAIELGLIPDNFVNEADVSQIFNGILFGGADEEGLSTRDRKLREYGTKLYDFINEISRIQVGRNYREVEDSGGEPAVSTYVAPTIVKTID